MEQRVSQTELSKRLANAARIVSVGSLYRHYKGNVYKITGVAIIEATNEVCVVYQAQYGDKLIFVRPLANWIETVEADGKQVQRFTPL